MEAKTQEMDDGSISSSSPSPLPLTCLFVHGVGELVDTGGNLQPLIENTTLSLQTNILWPLHKSSQVPLWLNATPYVDMIASQ